MRFLRAVLLESSLILRLAGQAAAPPPRQTGNRTNGIWAKSGKAKEVYRWRLHACDVREKIGLPRGRVFRRQGDSATLPDVVWQIVYPNEAARFWCPNRFGVERRLLISSFRNCAYNGTTACRRLRLSDSQTHLQRQRRVYRSSPGRRTVALRVVHSPRLFR